MKYFGEIEDCSECPLENTNLCVNTYEKDAPCVREQYWDIPLNEIKNHLIFEQEIEEDFYRENSLL